VHDHIISPRVEVSDNKTKHRQKLLEQGKVGLRLMTSQSLQIFNGRHHELVDRYEISISQMSMDLLSEDFFFNSSITDKISKPHLTI
jgi:hypothetical protein